MPCINMDFTCNLNHKIGDMIFYIPSDLVALFCDGDDINTLRSSGVYMSVT